MAKLQNPQSNLESIKQDYRDKHASAGGVLVCRKYDRQCIVDGQPLCDKKTGKPIMKRDWYEGKKLTVNEDRYVRGSHLLSEKHHNDCYATINHFPMEYTPADCAATNGGKYRTADNIAYLIGFYLDFDHRKIHELAKNKQAPPEMVEEALGYAEMIVATLENYTESASFFTPSFGMPVITFTGGGYGFYFPLTPIPATPEFKERYMEIWEKLYRRFSSLFEGILDVFDNDHAVLDFARVIRITGTYNSKTGTYAQYIGRYGNAATNAVYDYSLDDIRLAYCLDRITVDSPIEEKNKRLVKDSPLQKEREKKEEKKESEPKEICGPAPMACVDSNSQSHYTNKGNVAYPSKWYQGFSNRKQLGRYLNLTVKSLEYLDGQGDLQRNNVLFLVACLKTEIEYAKYGCYIFGDVCGELQWDIFNYIKDLNGNLANPLEDEELESLVKSALSNQYHFRKRDTIQRFLNLTDAEFESLGWLDKQRQEEQKHERNNALTDLDRDVIKLYLSGLSDAKIATALNITKRTSINIRQRLGVLDRTVQFEDINFDDHKRHLKHDKADAPAPAPIYPYMSWYTPTPKTMHAIDSAGNTRLKNAVVERAKVLADCIKSGVLVETPQMRMLRLSQQASEDEKQKIAAEFEEMMRQAEEQHKSDMIRQARERYGDCYDDYRADYKRMYGVEFWERIG